MTAPRIQNLATSETYTITGHTEMGWMIGAYWLHLDNGEDVATFDVITPDTPEDKRDGRHWQIVEQTS